jgi:hypothetical protein
MMVAIEAAKPIAPTKAAPIFPEMGHSRILAMMSDITELRHKGN